MYPAWQSATPTALMNTLSTTGCETRPRSPRRMHGSTTAYANGAYTCGFSCGAGRRRERGSCGRAIAEAGVTSTMGSRRACLRHLIFGLLCLPGHYQVHVHYVLAGTCTVGAPLPILHVPVLLVVQAQDAVNRGAVNTGTVGSHPMPTVRTVSCTSLVHNIQTVHMGS